MQLLLQRNCLAGLTLQTFRELELGQTTFALGLNLTASQAAGLEDNNEADIKTTGVKIKNIL